MRCDYDFPPRASQNGGKFHKQSTFITVQKRSVNFEPREQDLGEKIRKKPLDQSDVSYRVTGASRLGLDPAHLW